MLLKLPFLSSWFHLSCAFGYWPHVKTKWKEKKAAAANQLLLVSSATQEETLSEV